MESSATECGGDRTRIAKFATLSRDDSEKIENYQVASWECAGGIAYPFITLNDPWLDDLLLVWTSLSTTSRAAILRLAYEELK